MTHLYKKTEGGVYIGSSGIDGTLRVLFTARGESDHEVIHSIESHEDAFERITDVDAFERGGGRRLVTVKQVVNVDPFPFRLGEVRVAYPGTLNGMRVEYNPRPEWDRVTWEEEES